MFLKFINEEKRHAYKNIYYFDFGSIIFTSCSRRHVPLIFTSGITVGIETGISSAPSQTVVGYKQVDAVYLPTAYITENIEEIEGVKKQTNDFTPIRGCLNKGTLVGQVHQCKSDGDDSTTHTKHSDQEVLNLEDGQNPEHQSSNDALSVFSSFTGGKGEGSISLGKLFATGVAAQHFSDGVMEKLSSENQAKITQAIANCIKNLEESMGKGKVTTDDIAVCKSS